MVTYEVTFTSGFSCEVNGESITDVIGNALRHRTRGNVRIREDSKPAIKDETPIGSIRMIEYVQSDYGIERKIFGES